MLLLYSGPSLCVKLFAGFCRVLARTLCLNSLLQMCQFVLLVLVIVHLYFGISLWYCFVVCCVCWIPPPHAICVLGVVVGVAVGVAVRLKLELIVAWIVMGGPLQDCSAWCSPLPDKFPFAGGGFSVDWMGARGEDSSGHWLMLVVWTLGSSLSGPSSQLFGGSLLSSSGILSSTLWGVVYPMTYFILLGGVPDFAGAGGTPALPLRGVLAYFLSGYYFFLQ